MNHDDISEAWARRLLAELSAVDAKKYRTLVQYEEGISLRTLRHAHWRPVLGKDLESVGNLVTCADCRAVYEMPAKPPPMGLRGEPGTPSFKTYGPNLHSLTVDDKEPR